MSCPQCFTGHVHAGKPLGHVEDRYGRKTYVSEPKEASKGTIVYVPDAFGWEFVNNRILADHYASRTGYTVLLPDFMSDRSVPVKAISLSGSLLKDRGLIAWLMKPFLLVRLIIMFLPFIVINGRMSAKSKEVRAYLEALRVSDVGALPIGAAGFCWGGKMVFLLATGEKASNGRPLVDAIFTGHPSAISVPGDIEKVRVPFSIAIGDKDMAMNLSKVEQTEKILNGIEGLKSEVVVYKGGVEHGFCVRAEFGSNSSDAADKAEDQAVKWFKQNLDDVKHT